MAGENVDQMIVEQNTVGDARYKQKCSEFKRSIFWIVLALSLGLGLLLGGILDHDMPLSRRSLAFFIPSAIELVVGVLLIYEHLKQFGLSAPKIDSEEKQPKLELSTDYPCAHDLMRRYN